MEYYQLPATVKKIITLVFMVVLKLD